MFNRVEENLKLGGQSGAETPDGLTVTMEEATMTANVNVTTLPSAIPLFDTAKALDQRRERREITRTVASLIDWPGEYDTASYISAWARVARKENTAAIAEAIEQFTPDEIAAFVVALVNKAVEW